MSCFIQVQNSLPNESDAILKGILSKVISPTFNSREFSKSKGGQRSLSFSSQTLLKSKADKRFVQEVKLADQLQHIVMIKDYDLMKKKLVKYGKSKSYKIGTIMTKVQPVSYFQSEQQAKQHRTKCPSTNSFNPRLNIDMLSVIKEQERLAKVRYTMGSIYSAKDSNDRVVFVERKYDKEFAIQKASLIEAKEIERRKVEYKEFLGGWKRKDPLVKEAKVSVEKGHSDYEKQTMNALGIIEKDSKKNKFYRGKRIHASSHQRNCANKHNESDQGFRNGQFFNKKYPSAQVQKMIMSVSMDGLAPEQYNKDQKQNKGLVRKKFTSIQKQALSFFSLRNNKYP